MHVDLLTLYYIALGTLLLSAGMTFLEWTVRAPRRRELATLAGGYTLLAVGCAMASVRGNLPGSLGSALSNLTTVAGYLLILDGVASLSGRRYRTASFALFAAMALAWAIGGQRWQDDLWSYAGAFPIALASGAMAWAMLRSDHLRSLPSGRVVAVVTAGHALLYGSRTLLLPVLAAYHEGIVSVVGKLTIYEGVLFSVALPMALLTLVREEAQNQLLKASRTDYLTGLANRRWFFEEGSRLILAEGTRRPITLLAIDLDHFKAINDLFGHGTGDDVLRSFARVAEDIFGPGVLLARIGGEEFAALVPGHDSLAARRAGQTLAGAFSNTVALNFAGIPQTVTVSIGVAELGRDATDLASLLAAADRALYVAKALGRNRIEHARPAPLTVAAKPAFA
jgi:diguanylate cyclase (GGDEF)-like protein